MKLVLCTHCTRHVRESEQSCPFCKAVVVVAIAAAAATAACGKTGRGGNADIHGGPPVELKDASTATTPPSPSGDPSAMIALYGAPPVVDAGPPSTKKK